MKSNTYRHQDNNSINTNTTVTSSVSDFNNVQGYAYEQLALQEFKFLLNEHIGRLETSLRRSEAYSLKPFPKYMNQKEVIAYLGHEKIFWILVNEYGLKPIRQEHRLNIYCSKQVDEKCVMLELNLAA
jgi:hypothetical protein